MSISVAVHLLSGKRAFVEVEADELVESLKHRAQSALVAGRGRLLHSSGEVLDGTKTITEAKLKSGDMLSLHVSQVQLTATRQGGMFPGLAFAALLGDRSVVAWGAPDFGGDCSAVQGQLKNVQQIQASGRASAAILANGSVVTWGSADFGGDSRAVQEQLRDVQQIQACFGAFAAILGDGSVVTWGHDAYGGDSRAVQEQLRDVQQIQACFGAFAAIRSDGSVVTWGDADRGGDSSEVQDQLRDVQQIQASCGAFAAIRSDGSVVTWGSADFGGDSRAVQEQLRDVQQIQASTYAFAAVLGDGSVVTWGSADNGGDSSAVQDQLRDAQQIQASYGAFAAILRDGSVVTWGLANYGGDSSAVQEQLRDVQQIQASSRAFAAVLGDGAVITWGHADYGGDSSLVQDQLRDVQQIQASSRSFAAILGDGSVVAWGHAGDSIQLQDAKGKFQLCGDLESDGGFRGTIGADGSAGSFHLRPFETVLEYGPGNPEWLAGQWTKLHPNWKEMGMLLVRGTPELPESRNNVVHELEFNEEQERASLRIRVCWDCKNPSSDAAAETAASGNAFWRLAPGELSRLGGPDVPGFVVNVWRGKHTLLCLARSMAFGLGLCTEELPTLKVL
ncbi:putative E3 ubiquitin-protein ligase HERC2 [Symbiodinium microadriaticum]|uniref:Putative E3 ubiquitin-protein ligase HERC2 n=1 Tax=Symbiodinium microadriaticum TaxID=2951 RepID=A0A1Q9E211_SYMMI|nr:putative E3 ubiquitin-protein ligase HERC2 [Symbiodinium microadriaticum]